MKKIKQKIAQIKFNKFIKTYFPHIYPAIKNKDLLLMEPQNNICYQPISQRKKLYGYIRVIKTALIHNIPITFMVLKKHQVPSTLSSLKNLIDNHLNLKHTNKAYKLDLSTNTINFFDKTDPQKTTGSIQVKCVQSRITGKTCDRITIDGQTPCSIIENQEWRHS